MRRGAVLSALLLTALLLYLWPGLLKGLWTEEDNRMADELRPAQRRDLTLWWIPGETGDQRCISRLCTRLEKETPGLRVFLRRADAAELTAPDTLLPDAVLFGTGDVVNPEQLFLPLTLSGDDGNLSSGRSGGETYALPLWYEENVLSVPGGWLEESGAPSVTAEPRSLLGQASATRTPEQDEAPSVPWRRLLEKDALWVSPGTAGPQLLFTAPASLRTELASAALASAEKPAKGAARVWSRREHLAAAQKEALTAFPLRPAVSNRTRYAALCRNTAETRTLLSFLISSACREEAEAAGLVPAGNADSLPNAFAHTREELNALCADGLRRGLDPVEILLRLR